MNHPVVIWLGLVMCFIMEDTSAAPIADPCVPGNHRLMKDQESRSTSYIPTLAACDRRLKEDWYHVISKAGEDMPTTCPPEVRCNTLYPVWLNGSLPPNDGKIYSMNASLRYDEDCSADTWPIRVKNCGKFRVYYLTATSSCPATYCFGTGSPCPAGQNSESGYTPCSSGNTDPPKNKTDVTTARGISEISTRGISTTTTRGIPDTLTRANPDPCLPGNHRLMKDQESRSTSHIPTLAACDRRLKEDWYHVISKAGEDMPTTCPPEVRCNTMYPVWLNGYLPPNDGKIYSMNASLRYDEDCSADTWPIRVKNCGKFRVYYLTAVSSCPATYCFGTGSPCPAGQSSESGYTPCSSGNTDPPKNKTDVTTARGTPETSTRGISTTTTRGNPDPCLPENHRLMKDQESRSTSHIPTLAACDRRLKEDWYHVISKAGEDMPTTCPPEVRCNTLYPIWLNGALPPSDGKIHTMTASLRYQYKCSFDSWPIRVKNCGKFRVYYLTPVTSCPAVYCFGGDKENDSSVKQTTETTETSSIPTSELNTISHEVVDKGGKTEISHFWYAVVVAGLVGVIAVVTGVSTVVLKTRRVISDVPCDGKMLKGQICPVDNEYTSSNFGMKKDLSGVDVSKVIGYENPAVLYDEPPEYDDVVQSNAYEQLKDRVSTVPGVYDEINDGYERVVAPEHIYEKIE